MTRLTPSVGFDGEDDELYTGVLVSAELVTSKLHPDWLQQLQVEWEARQGATLRDWLPQKPSSNGNGLRLVNMLNALGEKEKDTELWFDPDTLEWGYDLDGDDSTPAYAVLTPGMALQFKGESVKKNGASRYRITGYRAPKAKKK